MKPEDKKRLIELFSSKANGSISEVDHQELTQQLDENADVRALWFLHQDIEYGLEGLAASPPAVKRNLYLSPWFSAAAGLILGCFGTTIVMGMKAEPLGRGVVQWFSENFSQSPSSSSSLFPERLAEWSGSSSIIEKEGDAVLRLDAGEIEFMGRGIIALDLTNIATPERKRLSIQASFLSEKSGVKSRHLARAAIFDTGIESIDPAWMKEDWAVIGDHAVSRVTHGSTVWMDDAREWRRLELGLDLPANGKTLVLILGAFTVDHNDERVLTYVDDVDISIVMPRSK